MEHVSTEVMLTNAKLELSKEQADGYYSPCGDYDLVCINDKLHRAPKGMYDDPLMKAPLPSRFWSLVRVMPVPEAETSNELMAVAADRVWVLKSQTAPHVEHEPDEPVFFYSRNLHDLMSKGVSSNNEYSLSYVKATPLHSHWFQLLSILEELEPQQPWRAWSCSASTLHLIAHNMREWHTVLYESKLPENLIGTVKLKLQAAINLTKTIMEEIKHD